MPEPGSENAFLEALRRLFATADPAVLVGGGPDDCAHILPGPGPIGVTADAFVEGSHFLPDTPPEKAADKVFGAALSDLAASGYEGRWLVLTACFRKGLPADWPLRYADRCAVCAKKYGVAVVGGDTVTGESTCLTATALGVPMKGGPVLRSSAKPGDAIVVTGRLGGSLLGRHLDPTPRFAEMRFALDFFAGREPGENGMGAAMDISDGLLLDLSRLCRESNVGAVVEDDRVPIADAAYEMAGRTGRPPLEHALGDGEDFELLMTMRPRAWEEFSKHAAAEGEAAELAAFTRIGWIGDRPGIWRRNRQGDCVRAAAKGFEHTW